jgi:site-specific DNA-methyltransferase (adenine-specific)
MLNVDLKYGDCLDRMLEIEAGTIDVVLCDLPYGVTKCKWDDVIPLDLLWAHYRRVLKPSGVVVLTASQPFTSALVMSNPRWFRHEWIWRKSGVTGFLHARRKPLKNHESILVFGQRVPRYFPQGLVERRRRRRRRTSCTTIYSKHGSDWIQTHTNYPRSVLEFPSQRATKHPSEKPVALMEYLIKTYSREGDTVLDNAMGSGTTGVACVQTNRRFVGIER